MWLEKVRIKRVCGCCSLDIGCIVIAVLQLISAYGIYVESFEYIIESIFGRVSLSAIIVYNILVAIITFLKLISLITGVIKKNASLLKLWIVIQTIECVLLIVFFVFLVTCTIFVRVKVIYIVYLICGIAIELVICSYFWICVWTIYLQLLEEEEERNNQNLAECSKLKQLQEPSNC